jgi:hypothetical protein
MKTSFVLPLLFLSAGGHSAIALAQSPDTFTATGNMTTPRSFHTATLLADGRVLVAGGGSDVVNTLSSAELYDPRTGTFTATGKMTTPRAQHTATLLPDGKVLIAGGRFGSFADSTLTTAELYDPGTGRFTGTGEMSTFRLGSTATLLNSGKVLFAGGLNGKFSPGVGYCCFPVAAELYDPATGTFAATGNMISEFADTATLLPNGKILVTKGNPQGPGPYLTSAELYDPLIGTFTPAGYATTNHSVPTASLMMNGTVLIAGGDISDGDGGSFIAELYDPATGAFSRTGNMTVGREQHTATLLPDGSVLFAGGHLVIDLAASAEIYDPMQGAFTRTANMPTPHEVHTATLLGDGTVLVAGGFAPYPAITSNAEIYHPAIVVPSPQLFSVSGDGRGQGAILHAGTARVVTASDPAVPGEVLEIYGTGLQDGSVIPPEVAIGGRLAEILYFGNAPGFTGLNQVNVRVPGGVMSASAVPVRLSYLGRSSNEVTIGVSKPEAAI